MERSRRDVGSSTDNDPLDISLCLIRRWQLKRIYRALELLGFKIAEVVV